MKRIFPTDKDDQMSKSTRETVQTDFRDYKDAEIEGLKKSDKAVKILGL